MNPWSRPDRHGTMRHPAMLGLLRSLLATPRSVLPTGCTSRKRWRQRATTSRGRTCRWARTRRKRKPSTRRASGGSWHCEETVACTTDTSAGTPDRPSHTSSSCERMARSVQPAIRRSFHFECGSRFGLVGRGNTACASEHRSSACPDNDLAKDRQRGRGPVVCAGCVPPVLRAHSPMIAFCNLRIESTCARDGERARADRTRHAVAGGSPSQSP
jgi:hypothetical protein